MKLLFILTVLVVCCGCSVPVSNIKKIQYYEPTKANEEYCKQPQKGNTGHGPVKSIEYQVKEQINYNFNIKNSAVGL